MNGPRINIQRLLADIGELSQIGRLENQGVCRRAFDPAELRAREWFLAKLKAAGLGSRIDAAGNLIGRHGPATGAAVVSGSHLDTVDGGGFYDGALGVLCALEALRTIKENNLAPATPFEAIAFCDEEERFLGFLGSLAICGQVDAETAGRITDEQGLALSAAMASAGLDPARIGEAHIPADQIKYFVELHVEQGPLLERAGNLLGLVELVKANYRFNIIVRGRRDHAGSPMAGRRDPLMAAMRVINRFGSVIREAGDEETLYTVGVFEVDPGIQTIIPQSVRFTVDFRGREAKTMADLEARLRGLMAGECSELEWSMTDLMREDPVVFDARVREAIEASLREEGQPWQIICSGPGHDGQVMGRYVPAGMIFVSSADGRSHCPEEWSDPKAIEAGANVLLNTLLKLARA